MVGCVIATAPPVAATAIAAACGVVPSAFTSCTIDEVLPVVGETVKVAEATTPAAIVFVFKPVTRQIIRPPPPLQVMDLPAATAAGPVLTLSPEKSMLEYVNVHCKPATWLGGGVLKVTFSDTAWPGDADPEESTRLVCA